MNLIYRLILKITGVLNQLYHHAYIETCKSRGLQLGREVILIGTPDFGSEPYLIEIGARTKITAGTKFITHDGATYTIRNFKKYEDARRFDRIKIGENCFVGNSCILLPGAGMGDNCILGAGSVLKAKMPDNTVYAGVPARFISTIKDYGQKILDNNTTYPRELEKNRGRLDDYLKANL